MGTILDNLANDGEIPDIDSMEQDELISDVLVDRDENGNYVKLLPRLEDCIPVEISKRRVQQREALFRESVVETILERWDRNPSMKSDLLPDFPYVGLLLDTSSSTVGGFSLRDRKNEAKGSIVECINSGLIVTLVTPGLLENGLLVFLPEFETVDAMKEFSIFTKSEYSICFINDTGMVQKTDLTLSFLQILSIVTDDIPITGLLIDALEDAEDDYYDTF